MWSGSRLALLAASLLMIAGLALAPAVTANLVAPPRPPDVTFRLQDPVSGILWLFVLNFLINLALITGGLFVSSKLYGKEVGELPAKGSTFLMALLFAVAVITWVGAFVDFYLVTQSVYLDSLYDKDYHVISFGFFRWTAALLIIFTSIALAMFVFLRLRIESCLLSAAIITVMNPIWWILISEFGEKISFATIIIGVIVAPAVLRWVVLWHLENIRPTTKAAAQGTRTS